MSGCGGNCDCGSGCTCGSGCLCGMYPDLGSSEKATVAATIIITGVAPAKMYSEGSEMSQEGGKGCKSGNGCKCGNSCNCDPCNC